jgi:hypothetical protein
MATKIMIIRHAEKPAADGSIAGVSQIGLQDSEGLSSGAGNGPAR